MRSQRTAPTQATSLPAAGRLRSHGLRVTRPRTAVLGILDDAQRSQEHLTAAQVADRARDALGTVSLQAVYDCLQALADAGLARRIEPAGHAALYEGRVDDNHHHLVCRDCGRTVDVDCVVGSAACLTPDRSHGFTVDEAEVVFWGRCPECLGPTAAAAHPTQTSPPADRPANRRTTERNTDD